MSSAEIIGEAIAAIQAPDEAARDRARALQSRLTKPAGALGRLEDLHVWAAGIRRETTPAPGGAVIVVAAGDHGVAEEGVSAYPQNVTAQMVANFLAGGTAVNVLAAQAGARVRIVDAGVRAGGSGKREAGSGIKPDGRGKREARSGIERLSGDVACDALHVAKVRDGTANMTRGAAMTRGEAETLIARGVVFAREECANGARAIGLGDMGIGNTTAAAAITSVLTGAPARMTAGRGTGIDDAAFAVKVDAIERAIVVNAPDATDPLGVMASVGGCELAFLCGVTIGGAASGVPVVLDGYPTTAAALVAAAMAPSCGDYMLASHVSAEPGHRIALEHLELRPLLDLEMRLGEGSGAALALTLLDAALRLPREMATFDSAGVSRSATETRAEA